MKAVINQTNFTAGELSPRMKGRGDVARYQNGAETIENGIVVVHGGVVRRQGTRYLATAKLGGDRIVRLIRYVYAVDQAYVLEFGHLYIRFYDGATGAVIIDPATSLPFEVVSPYTSDQLSNVRTKQSADLMFLYHPEVPTQQLQRLTTLLWVLRPVKWATEPFAEIGHTPNARLQLSAATPGTGVAFTTSPVSAPGAPLSVSATPFNSAARVAFSPPASSGGAGVTSYAVTSSPGGVTGTGVGSPIMVTGLTNGVSYTFTVVASNKAGPGPASSPSAPVTPLGSLPGGSLTVTGSNFAATVKNGAFAVIGPTVSISGGQGPYTVSWTKLSGSSGIYIYATGNPLQMESSGFGTTLTARVRATATDANGATGSIDLNLTITHQTGNNNEVPQ